MEKGRGPGVSGEDTIGVGCIMLVRLVDSVVRLVARNKKDLDPVTRIQNQPVLPSGFG